MAKLRMLAERPPIPRGTAEEQLRELRDYVCRLKDELEYLLTHMGEDNLDAGTREQLRQLEKLRIRTDELENRKQDLLTFDDVPRAGSGNPVTGGGLFEALAGKTSNRVIQLMPGQTLTITTPNGALYSLLVCIAGAGSLNALYFLSGYSNMIQHKSIGALAPSADISVSKTGGDFTVKNNHGSYGMRVGILLAAEEPTGALGFEVTG